MFNSTPCAPVLVVRFLFPKLLLKLISPPDEFAYYTLIPLFEVNVIYSKNDNNEACSSELNSVLVVRFLVGFVNGHSDEYDAINAVVSRTNLGNVSLVLKEFNISDNTNLFNIGEIYKRYNNNNDLSN